MTAATPARDRGSAMVITLMVLALVTALSTTVAVLTINNLQSSQRAQEAGSALNSADAGIAQAMAYMQSRGVGDLDCTAADPGATACTRPWGSANKTRVTLSAATGQSYDVWIEAVRPFPANDPGQYRVHSLGRASGSASREVVTDVNVTTQGPPLGIFARTLTGGGNTKVSRESVFSTGCVYQRSKIDMVSGQIDAAYGIPIGVHSSQIITDSTGSGQYCPDTAKPVHRSGPDSTTLQPCDPSFPYDQDKLGGSLAATVCASSQTLYPDVYGAQDLDGDGTNDVNGSYLEDDEALFELFDIKSPAFSQAQLDEYRAIARQQGNYWTQATGWSSPDEANAVMFFDLAEQDLGGTVDLGGVTGFSRPANLSATDAACTSKSLMIVIDGGNARMNGNQTLAASIVLTSSAPNGQIFKANGNFALIGTIYADNINMNGNVDISLDNCFLENLSPTMLELGANSYRELDR